MTKSEKKHWLFDFFPKYTHTSPTNLLIKHYRRRHYKLTKVSDFKIMLIHWIILSTSGSWGHSLIIKSKFLFNFTQQVLRWRLVQIWYRNHKLLLLVISYLNYKAALWDITAPLKTRQTETHCRSREWFGKKKIV